MNNLINNERMSQSKYKRTQDSTIHLIFVEECNLSISMISVQSDLLLPDRMMQTKTNGWEKASKYRRKYGFTGNKNLRAIQFYGNSFFPTICRTTPPSLLPLVRKRTNPNWILSKIFRCTCYLAMIQKYVFFHILCNANTF